MHTLKVDGGMSQAVSVDSRWRSWSAEQSMIYVSTSSQVDKCQRHWYRGREEEEMRAFARSCSRCATASNLCESGASRIMGNLMLGLRLINATSRWTLKWYIFVRINWPLSVDRLKSSSSACPESCYNDKPKTGLGDRGWVEAMWVLVDELDPEPELPLPTVIMRNIRFLFCFSNDSSVSTWMVARLN
jgi:ferredoxin-like protein FixX